MPYKDPEAQRAYQREWVARRRAEWIEANGPCVDCGGTDDLEVDHADAAEKVTHRVWSWSEERRAAELAKCVVRCHDCHLRKSRQEGDLARPHVKVSLDVVEEIRRRYAAGGVTQQQLADEYGVHRRSVSHYTTGDQRIFA